MVMAALFAAFRYAVLPVLLNAPRTDHYKTVKPFSAAVHLALGKEVADRMVRIEGLRYCGVLPVKLCAVIALDTKLSTPEQVEQASRAIDGACELFSNAKRQDLLELTATRGYKVQDLRETLRAYAGCNKMTSAFSRLPDSRWKGGPELLVVQLEAAPPY